MKRTLVICGICILTPLVIAGALVIASAGWVADELAGVR